MRRLELRRCWLSHLLSTLAFLTFMTTFRLINAFDRGRRRNPNACG
jgi:hypothetical protein